jgi:hypothetical protein
MTNHCFKQFMRWLWILQVHCRQHKMQPLASVMSQFTPLDMITVICLIILILTNVRELSLYVGLLILIREVLNSRLGVETGYPPTFLSPGIQTQYIIMDHDHFRLRAILQP